MYLLDTNDGPVEAMVPLQFTNAQGQPVGVDMFSRSAAERLEAGIWTLESDELPVGDVVITGRSYEKLESVQVRHWITRAKTTQELADEAARALQAAQADASETVDAQAGLQRAKYITVAIGQDMTYQEKVRQAQALLADQTPSEQNYPLIFGEVGITADDAPGVASVILAAYAQWQVIGAAIERIRLGAKKAVAEAADSAAVAQVLAGIAWPQPPA